MFGLSLYGKASDEQNTDISFQEALEYTTKDNENAVITVGSLKTVRLLILFMVKTEKNLRRNCIHMKSVR